MRERLSIGLWRLRGFCCRQTPVDDSLSTRNAKVSEMFFHWHSTHIASKSSRRVLFYPKCLLSVATASYKTRLAKLFLAIFKCFFEQMCLSLSIIKFGTDQCSEMLRMFPRRATRHGNDQKFFVLCPRMLVTGSFHSHTHTNIFRCVEHVQDHDSTSSQHKTLA